MTVSNPIQPNPYGGANGQEGTDTVWVILTAFIIFTMQSGFGLLESGMVSRRSEANVMVKNMLDVALGGVTYWFVGFGFSFGPNTKGSRVFGGGSYYMTDVDISDNSSEAYIYAKYFFQLSFATTATTIVSGAVAERIQLRAYMLFVVIMTALIYVFPCHWVWDENGWLYGRAQDFAGSAVVHMSGGAAAFAGTLWLKPRLYRYINEDSYFAMASPTNVVLGTFFLWWGWIGFNCGSTFAITGNHWRLVGRVAVVTMNGGMAGGAAATIFNVIAFKWRNYLIDIPEFTAGILGGLVAVTAPANVIRPWEALVIGGIGGFVAIGLIKLLDKFHIDDPVGCVGVHWGAGLWAMIATGLFSEDGGVFRSGKGYVLAWNLAAAITITMWSFGCSSIVFLVMKYTIGIRMTEEEEVAGSDEVEHNILDTSHALGRKINVDTSDGKDMGKNRRRSVQKRGSGPLAAVPNYSIPGSDGNIIEFKIEKGTYEMEKIPEVGVDNEIDTVKV